MARGRMRGVEVVDERTGEAAEPAEYLENLRGLEREVQRMDDAIAVLKADLKAAREGREALVGKLRSAIREGKVLPLFEGEVAQTSAPEARA